MVGSYDSASFWGPAYFQSENVSFREGTFFLREIYWETSNARPILGMILHHSFSNPLPPNYEIFVFVGVYFTLGQISFNKADFVYEISSRAFPLQKQSSKVVE